MQSKSRANTTPDLLLILLTRSSKVQREAKGEFMIKILQKFLQNM